MKITYNDFWSYPDKKQADLLRHINSVFPELQDEIQDILNRFPTFGGELTKRERERLYKIIEKYADEDFYDSQALKLYMQDLNRRIRIKRDYAFDVLIAAAFFRYYADIYSEAKIINADIFKAQYKKISGIEYTKAIPKTIYTEPLPSGVSPNDMVNVEAEFRARQTARAIKAQRISNEDFKDINVKPVNLEFERARNALLRKSETKGYHGVMDVIMTSTIGYAAMAALESTDADTYTFYNPLDGRTTDICTYLAKTDEGTVYPVSGMRFGWNVPPIFNDIRYNTPIPHSCRSWIRINYKG